MNIMRCAVHIYWISVKLLSDGKSFDCTRRLALHDFVVKFPDDVTKQIKYMCVFNLYIEVEMTQLNKTFDDGLSVRPQAFINAILGHDA